MQRIAVLFILLLFAHTSHAQEVFQPDSVMQLRKVTVEGYISGQPLLQTPTSVGILDAARLRSQADETLLPALNSIPGVRMEERSPGSYRLSLRGSLLRSPWGVRNVKVYLDEFPLTDAGGNTYLNLIDPRGIGRLEVLKGPHGSLFGANSGGVLLIDPAGQPRGNTLEPGGSGLQPGGGLELGISGGSYGMIHQSASLEQRLRNSRFNLNQAFLRSDGYRENSARRRHYLQASHRWDYSAGKELKMLAFYADQEYATPGGLNEEQYRHDPRQARPAAGPNPGAVEQQAGIENRTFFGGISHGLQISGRLRHVASVFGSKTDFENPFITNYEVRDEDNYGLRTYLELDAAKDAPFSWKWHLGLEWQRSHHDITNFDNDGNAAKGDPQASDAIHTRQHFYFARFSAGLSERLRAEAAVSLNYYQYVFKDLTGGDKGAGEAAENGSGKRAFSAEWMPSLSFSYLLGPALSWRASLSRGYSPPTTAEIRPSNILINTSLNAETGWNYETGFRFMSENNRFQADASVFYYRMQEAIVRRSDEGGNEYFINSGGTDQSGLESMIMYWITPFRAYGAVRGLQLRNSYTYSHFRFRAYLQGSEDYTGNRLTGVPRTIAVSGLTLHLPEAFLLSAQHNYTSRIPLDDANSAYAGSYNLVQLKLRWQKQIANRHSVELFAGVDNLLNEKYSLGNDINAFGNRFFNAAPLRNFFGGLALALR